MSPRLPRPLVTAVSDRTWAGHQSWNREVIERTGERDTPFRYRIKVDAFPQQSYARAERWDGAKWHTVHSISGHDIATKVSYVAKDVTPTAFDADLAELRRVTRRVTS